MFSTRESGFNLEQPPREGLGADAKRYSLVNDWDKLVGLAMDFAVRSTMVSTER